MAFLDELNSILGNKPQTNTAVLPVVQAQPNATVVPPGFVGPTRSAAPAPTYKSLPPLQGSQVNPQATAPAPTVQPAASAPVVQPVAPGNFLSGLNAILKSGVTGINGTPAPRPVPSGQNQMPYINATQALQEGMGQPKDLPSKILHPVANFVLGLASPIINGIGNAEDFTKEFYNYAAKNGRFGETGIGSLEPSQAFGYGMSTGLGVGSLFTAGLTSAVGEGVAEASTASAVKVTAQQFAKNVGTSFVKNLAQYGIPFATSGELEKPSDQRSLVSAAANAAMIATFGTLAEHGLPMAKFTVDKVNELQVNFQNELISKGYSLAEAQKLATQGGYVGGVPEKGVTDIQPKSKETKAEFITSLQENPDTAEAFKGKDLMLPTKPNIESKGTAEQLVNTNPEAARQLAYSTEKTAEVAQVRKLLIKQAIAQGNIAEANRLGEFAAKESRTGGQFIQAHDFNDVGTPEGALIQAQKVFDKVNQDLPPDAPKKVLSEQDSKNIIEKASDIQQLPEGSDKSYQKALLEKQISDMAPSSKLEKAIAVWKAGLVSAPTTKLIKAGSEAAFQGLTNVSDVVSTGVDKLLYLFSKTRTRSASVGGLVEQFKGLKTGTKGAWDYVKTGVGSGYFDHLRTQMKDAGIYDFQGKEVHFDNPIINAYVKYTFRALSAETRVYQEMGVKASLFEQARVQALNEGSKGKAFKARVQELYLNPTDEMAAQAINDANYRVFQNENVLSSGISNLKRTIKEKSPIGGVMSEMVLPFQKIPLNIGKAAIVDYTPLGFVKALTEQLNPETSGQKALATTLGRAITGTGVISLGAWLANKGMMTGNYPTTKLERDQWNAEGKQPNSILINGRWFQLGRALGPTGELLGLGADFNNLSQDNKGVALAYQSALAGVKKIGDMPFLMGVSQTLQGIQQPDQYGNKLAEGTIGSLVPNIVTRLAKTLDTTQRNPQNPLQKIESNLPILSKRVSPKRDLFGDTITNPGEDASLIDPFMSRPNKPSPILEEANRVGANLTAPIQTLFNTKLDNKEYGVFLKVQGTVVKAGLDAMINADEYKNLSPSDQKTAIESTVRDLRTQVDAAIFPVLMIKRYGLPQDADPNTVKDVFTLLGKSDKYKKMPQSQQKAMVQKIFNKLNENK